MKKLPDCEYMINTVENVIWTTNRAKEYFFGSKVGTVSIKRYLRNNLYHLTILVTSSYFYYSYESIS